MRRNLMAAASTPAAAPAALPPDDSDLLPNDEAANYLGVTVRTMLRMRATGSGPKYCRIGERKILYRRGDLREWVASRTFAHRAAELAGAGVRA